MIRNLRPTASGTKDDLARWIREAALAVNALIGGKLEWVAAPSATTDPGRAGQAAYDDDYLYLHNGTEWRRIAISTW